MNAMGDDVPAMIGVEDRGVVREINKLLPDYMVMGERGMADMEMPIPDNTARMMGGESPYGSTEIGGMFSVLKVRKNQAPGDYKDPGWYQAPAGTTAFEWTGALPEPTRFAAEGRGSMPAARGQSPQEIEVQIRKPAAGSAQHNH